MCVPNFFVKLPLPRRLPKEIRAEVHKLKRLKSKEECVRAVYHVLVKRFHGERLRTYTRFRELFITDVNILWARRGFMHCTHLNYLLRLLLVKSGWFRERDVRQRLTLVWFFSPHQYVQVRIHNKWWDVDVWARHDNILLGDYAHGSHA